jgi:hypothetical protein
LADFVDSTVRDIDSRLEELKLEVTKLEAARTALVGGRRSTPRSSSSSNGASTATPRRAPRADLVKSRPGITIPQIAEELKIEPNYLYRVMPKLVESGQVSREGQGWHPAGTTAE